MRGNGESDGLMLDEYTLQEQDDALEVIDWRARQPWCTGAVGRSACAEAAPPEVRTVLRPGGFERAFSYDVASDAMTYTSLADSALHRIDAIGLELEEIARKVYKIKSDDPLSADDFIHWTTRRGRGDWQVRIETRTRMRATREHFLIDAELDAHEGERRVFSRNWHAEIPRDLV